jgi:mono/diheme cytochrome c family protein
MTRLGRIPTAVSLGLVALVAGTVALAAAQTLWTSSQDPVAGARVFGAKGCAKCHSVNTLGGKVGPDLGKTDRPRSFYDLAAALWNHAPRMADKMRALSIPRPQLDPQETGDLVAYLYTIDYFQPKGNVDAGRRLFTDKRCVTCHQIRGSGGVVGPNLDAVGAYTSPISIAAAMWNHGPQMADAMRARGIPRPGFTETELVDLLAFIRASASTPDDAPLHLLPGRPDEGRRLFIANRCIDCHSVGGQGGKVGPDLAERGVHRSITAFAAAMWNKAPRMTAAMKTRSVPIPELTAEQMADIVGYLYSVRYFARTGDPGNGAKIAVAKGCLSCHGLYGERGKTASDLARSRSAESPAAVVAALWNHAFIGQPKAERERVAWAEVGSGEMGDLIAYLQSLKRANR